MLATCICMMTAYDKAGPNPSSTRLIVVCRDLNKGGMDFSLNAPSSRRSTASSAETAAKDPMGKAARKAHKATMRAYLTVVQQMTKLELACAGEGVIDLVELEEHSMEFEQATKELKKRIESFEQRRMAHVPGSAELQQSLALRHNPSTSRIHNSLSSNLSLDDGENGDLPWDSSGRGTLALSVNERKQRVNDHRSIAEWQASVVRCRIGLQHDLGESLVRYFFLSENLFSLWRFRD